MNEAKKEIIDIIDEKSQDFFKASDCIWENPETRFATEKSVEEHYKILEKEGFIIKKSVANMEYSYVATFGSGQPVIGMLAEYDALGNLSQVADSPEQKTLVAGSNGHGCGHNLLGIGALGGAVGIKEYIKRHNLSGTIKLFGCPAEESGYGKAFMARDGVFNGLDAALTWHPMDVNQAWGDSSLAVYQVYYKFKGVSAHAAAAPEKGRSALDAAELMNIGVQFLREHIIDQARIHYAFIDAGGESANVVQPTSKLYYFIRAPRTERAAEIYERLNKIAKGAALMTETELEIEFDSACANYLPNHALTKVMNENLKLVTPMDLSKEELEYEQKFYDTLPEETRKGLYLRAKKAFPELSEEELQDIANMPINTKVFPLAFTDNTAGSTDVGDVSWVVPTAQVTIGCEPQGTPPHSWQWVANGKSPVAHKGLLNAGKTIALTAYDILTNPELVQNMSKEHLNTLGGKKYVSAIPSDVMPH